MMILVPPKRVYIRICVCVCAPLGRGTVKIFVGIVGRALRHPSIRLYIFLRRGGMGIEVSHKKGGEKNTAPPHSGLTNCDVPHT